MLNDEFILKGDVQSYMDHQMFASIDEAIVKRVNEAFTKRNIYHMLERMSGGLRREGFWGRKAGQAVGRQQGGLEACRRWRRPSQVGAGELHRRSSPRKEEGGKKMRRLRAR
jgi:hypothetical protein